MKIFPRPSVQPGLHMNFLSSRFASGVALASHSFLPATGLTLLMSIGLMTVSGHAQAQNINGIFGTRSSEQFFQAGIARLQQEIDELVDETESANLSIDESVEQQRQNLQEDVSVPSFHVDPFSSQEDEL